jgi:hypothetical protein
MSLRHESSFAPQLKTFEGRIKELAERKKERLVLIIMSNTHDPILSAGCTKDAEAVKNTFQAICTNTGYIFCCIEISGKNYSRENLLKAIDAPKWTCEVIVIMLILIRLILLKSILKI